jgi:hypothetical protein
MKRNNSTLLVLTAFLTSVAVAALAGEKLNFSG